MHNYSLIMVHRLIFHEQRVQSKLKKKKRLLTMELS